MHTDYTYKKAQSLDDHGFLKKECPFFLIGIMVFLTGGLFNLQASYSFDLDDDDDPIVTSPFLSNDDVFESLLFGAHDMSSMPECGGHTVLQETDHDSAENLLFPLSPVVKQENNLEERTAVNADKKTPLLKSCTTQLGENLEGGPLKISKLSLERVPILSIVREDTGTNHATHSLSERFSKETIMNVEAEYYTPQEALQKINSLISNPIKPKGYEGLGFTICEGRIREFRLHFKKL